jgi:SAM-dependent methyltransferase
LQDSSPHGSAEKRLHPRFWRDHDWYSLLRLRQGIEATLAENELLDAGGVVVDLGCGDRPYAPLFRKANVKYIACDIDGEVDVRITPGERIPLDDASADIVVSFQVLEHVWDLDWYLGECRRLLRPGGWLLLSTHGTWLYHPHPTDFRRWTRDGLQGELTTRGFAVQSVRSVVGPLAWTTQFRLFGMRHVLQKVPVLGGILYRPLLGIMNAKMWLEDKVTPASIADVNASVYITLSQPA